MSWLIPRPVLQVGEVVAFSWTAATLQVPDRRRGPFADRLRDRPIEVGGRLTVTDRRLLFLPTRMDRHGRSVEVELRDITAVRLEVSAGLLAARPALPAVAVTHPGGEALFAVTRSRELMRSLRPPA